MGSNKSAISYWQSNREILQLLEYKKQQQLQTTVRLFKNHFKIIEETPTSLNN